MEQLTQLNVTENQIKVIKDKYLKDSPTIESWLRNVAKNIALTEILYSNKISELDIFKNVQYERVDYDFNKKLFRFFLIHKNLRTYPERMENFRKFISNLNEIADKYPELIKETEEKFYNLLSNFEFLPNSPCLMNAGRDLQMLSACFVLPVEDSMDGILDSLKNTGMVHKAGGGCIVEGSKVFTTFCGLTNIETIYNKLKKENLNEFQGADNGLCMDINKKNIYTMSFNQKKGIFEKDRLTHIWKYNVRKTDALKISLGKGISIITSNWHPFFVFDNGEIIEKRADELKINDQVILPNSSISENWLFNEYKKIDDVILDEDLAWCLGLFIGDGSIGYKSSKYKKRGYRLRVFDSNQETLENFNDVISKRFSIKKTKIQKDNREDCFYYLLQRENIIKKFMNILNIKPGIKTYTISIPEQLFKSPLKVIYSFIAGLIDSDGHISKSRKRITFDTVSKELAEQVVCLISLLGYSPAIREKKSKRKNHSIIYEVKIDSDFMIDFTKKIKPFVKNKEKVSRTLTKIGKEDKKARVINLKFSVIEDILEELGVKTKSTEIHKKSIKIGKKKFWLHRWKWGYNIDSVKFNELMNEILNQKNELSESSYNTILKLRNVANNITPVILIEKSDIKKDFYDFTVEKNNNYLAGNFGLSVIHNTGFSFSRLRPAGDAVMTTRGVSSGPITFMQLFDKQTEVIKQGSTRRGANMGILHYTHPDIMEFINMKKTPGVMENFNVSITTDDKFMQAVKNNKNYELINPRGGKAVGTLNAKEVWKLLIKGAWETGDPGIIMIDRMNNPDSNPTPALGQIEATNPCGEQPLLPYEVCNLGSINLSKFINKSGTDFDYERLGQCVFDCTHFLDNVIDVNNYPIPEIEEMAKVNRRIGLGVMGWAESLALLDIPYDSEEALHKAGKLMKFINDNSLSASEELAGERGVFPAFKDSVYDRNGKYFIKEKEAYPRNCARTTIAPTGTIAITAGLQGSGIEPFFSIVYVRYNAAALDSLKRGERPEEKDTFFEVNPIFEDVAKKNNYFGLTRKELYEKINNNHKSLRGIREIPEKIQRRFLTSHDLTPENHVLMQCAFQKYVNNAVSKTVNIKNEATEEDVERVYWLAYENGAKGVTVYRDGSKSFQVLNLGEKKKEEKKKYLPEFSDYYPMHTGQGPMHVHINYNEIGPTKIFANLSPAGTEISGITTAIAILLSKYFEHNGDPIRILKHLNSIKSEKPYGFGKNRIDSIPHAISVALRQHLIKTGKIKTLDSIQVDKEQQKLVDESADNGKRVYCPQCFSSNVGMVSGCSEPTCFDCGYSKCS